MSPALKKLMGTFVVVKSIDRLKKETAPARRPQARVGAAALLLAVLGTGVYLVKSGRLNGLLAKTKGGSPTADGPAAAASGNGLAPEGVTPLDAPTG